MEYRDYYATLGVGKKASQAEIKKAFRTLAREHHPDVNKGNTAAERRFKEAAELAARFPCFATAAPAEAATIAAAVEMLNVPAPSPPGGRLTGWPGALRAGAAFELADPGFFFGSAPAAASAFRAVAWSTLEEAVLTSTFDAFRASMTRELSSPRAFAIS